MHHCPTRYERISNTRERGISPLKAEINGSWTIPIANPKPYCLASDSFSFLDCVSHILNTSWSAICLGWCGVTGDSYSSLLVSLDGRQGVLVSWYLTEEEKHRAMACRGTSLPSLGLAVSFALDSVQGLIRTRQALPLCPSVFFDRLLWPTAETVLAFPLSSKDCVSHEFFFLYITSKIKLRVSLTAVP